MTTVPTMYPAVPVNRFELVSAIPLDVNPIMPPSKRMTPTAPNASTITMIRSQATEPHNGMPLSGRGGARATLDRK